jgi:hypothetical protein
MFAVYGIDENGFDAGVGEHRQQLAFSWTSLVITNEVTSDRALEEKRSDPSHCASSDCEDREVLLTVVLRLRGGT